MLENQIEDTNIGVSLVKKMLADAKENKWVNGTERDDTNLLYGGKTTPQIPRQEKLRKIEAMFVIKWSGQLIQAPPAGVLNDLLSTANEDHELVMQCIADAPIALKHQTPRSAANLVNILLKERVPDPAIKEAADRRKQIDAVIDDYAYVVNTSYGSSTGWSPYMGYETHREAIALVVASGASLDDVEQFVHKIKHTLKAPDVIEKLAEHFTGDTHGSKS